MTIYWYNGEQQRREKMQGKCSICGGEIKNGICTFCGQKNMIEESMNHQEQIYRTPIHESVEKKNNNKVIVITLVIIVVVFLIIASIGVFIYSSVNNAFGHLGGYSEDEWYGDSEDGWHEEPMEEEVSEFNYIFTQEPKYGSDVVEEVLDQGIYVVGVHIPEGSYTFNAEGQGSIEISDTINKISYSEFLYEVGSKQIENVVLCNDTVIRIEDSLQVTIKSENANNSTLKGEENTSVDPSFVYESTEEEILTVGEDIPAGIYDVSIITDYSTSLHTYVPGYSSYDETSATSYIWLTNYGNEEDDNVLHYYNLILPEGTILEVSEGIRLTPSMLTWEMDYIDHYDHYMYYEYVQ